jgi:hypothetical protein
LERSGAGPTVGLGLALAYSLALGCGHGERPRALPPRAEAVPSRTEPRTEQGPDARWERLGVRIETIEGVTVTTAEIVRPTIRLVRQASEEESQIATRAVAARLRQMLPLDVERVEIHDGTVVLVDETLPGAPSLHLSQLEVSVENLTTRRALADGLPALVTASGRIAGRGELSLFLTADPWGAGLNFAGRAAIRGLPLAALTPFARATVDLRTPGGTLDLFTAFVAERGRIRGGIKPIVSNLEVAAVGDAWTEETKAWLVNLALDFVSDRVEDRNALATIVPIVGELEDPGVQLWPTLLGLLYNAFIRGVTAGYANLPPATAAERRPVATQAYEALVVGRWPRAQPPRSAPRSQEGRP